MARQARIVIQGHPHLATGRPAASREFVKQLEQEPGKLMTPEPRDRKPAALANVIDRTEEMF